MWKSLDNICFDHKPLVSWFPCVQYSMTLKQKIASFRKKTVGGASNKSKADFHLWINMNEMKPLQTKSVDNCLESIRKKNRKGWTILFCFLCKSLCFLKSYKKQELWVCEKNNCEEVLSPSTNHFLMTTSPNLRLTLSSSPSLTPMLFQRKRAYEPEQLFAKNALLNIFMKGHWHLFGWSRRKKRGVSFILAYIVFDKSSVQKENRKCGG